jgi:O-antigen ligase
MLYILSVGVFLVSAHQVQEVRWLKWLVFLFLGIGTVAVVGRLGPASLGESINTLLFHANGSLLWMWLLTITASQGLFNKDLHPIWRVGLGLLFLATLYIMLTEFWAWNSGWMPAVASVGTIIFVALPWSRLPIILGGLVVVATKLQSLYDKIMVGDNAYSLSTRLDAWTIVLEIAKVNPILGLGPANYYYYTPLFPIRGYAVQFNSHQQYVDLIAQTGILGLVGFVWFFVAVGWVAWQIRNTVPEGFAQAYVFGAIGGVVGTLVSAAFGDWVIPFFYNVTLGGFRSSMLSWLFFGGLLALQQIYLPNISSKQSN